VWTVSATLSAAKALEPLRQRIQPKGRDALPVVRPASRAHADGFADFLIKRLELDPAI
jgi:hypothetical protein